jgi:arylsulfatase A-like enzyme
MRTLPPTDGLDLMPIFTQMKSTLNRDYLYWEFHENQGRQAIRWKQWKGILLQVNNPSAPPMELYDLEKDPSEKNNIAAQHPDIVQQLTRQIQIEHQQNPDWPLLPEERKGLK